MKLQIIIISLKQSSSRKYRMLQQLESFDIPYLFLEATDGRDLDNEWIENNIADDLKEYYYQKKHFSVNKNALACADSHRRAQLIARDFKDGYTLILEDDVELTKNFDGKIQHIISLMEKHSLNVSFLGYYIFNGSSEKRIDIKSRNFYPNIQLLSYPKNGRISGSFGYLVSSSGASKLVADNIDKIQRTADTFYINEKGMNDCTVLLYPKLVTTGFFDSDIGYIKKNETFSRKLKNNVFLLSKKSKLIRSVIRIYKERKI